MLAIDTREEDRVDVDRLPSRKSSDVKNNWGEITRTVNDIGRLALTTHARVQYVMLSVGTYIDLEKKARNNIDHQRRALDELRARFDTELAALQAPDAAERVAGLFAAKGKLKTRPKVGSF